MENYNFPLIVGQLFKFSVTLQWPHTYHTAEEHGNFIKNIFNDVLKQVAKYEEDRVKSFSIFKDAVVRLRRKKIKVMRRL